MSTCRHAIATCMGRYTFHGSGSASASASASGGAAGQEWTGEIYYEDADKMDAHDDIDVNKPSSTSKSTSLDTSNIELPTSASFIDKLSSGCSVDYFIPLSDTNHDKAYSGLSNDYLIPCSDNKQQTSSSPELIVNGENIYIQVMTLTILA